MERITPNGPVVLGKEYPVEVLIYATGFQFFATGTFNRIVGRTPGVSIGDGQTARHFLRG